MQHYKTAWLMVAGAMCLMATGCGGESIVSESGSDDGGLADLEGTVTIDGSSTVFPITESVAVAFDDQFPNVKVPIAISGTGGGFKRFTQGKTDISNASRPIKAGELAECYANGVTFVEAPIAYDGLTIVVHAQNDWCDQLTVAELQRIFVDRPEKPIRWNEVREQWPNQEIKIFIPGTDSGTFDYFQEVMEGQAIRGDVSASEDDNTLVTGVSSEKGAIGFFGCAYYFENKDRLRAVPIVNAEGEAVPPTPETIESGQYNPLSRPLFIYVNAERLKRPEVKLFVEFYLEHAAEHARRAGYVALPPAIYETVTDFVRNRRTGTCYSTADGEPRSGPLAEVYKAEHLASPVD